MPQCAERAHWFDADYFTRFSATIVRPIALTGVFCFAPRSGNQSSFRRTDRWLGAAPPAFTPGRCRRCGG